MRCFSNIKISAAILALSGLIFANAMAEEKKLKILAVGDSITSGSPEFYSPAEKPPDGAGNAEHQYAYWMMQKHPEWEVLNRGIAGQNTIQVKDRLERELDTFKPDRVIILVGVNSLIQKWGPDFIQKHLREMYQTAQAKNVKVIACSIMPYDFATPLAQQRLLAVNEWIKSYSQEHNLIFADTYSAFEDPAKPFGLRASDDGLHPNVEGHKLMAKVITDALEKT